MSDHSCEDLPISKVFEDGPIHSSQILIELQMFTSVPINSSTFESKKVCQNKNYDFTSKGESQDSKSICQYTIEIQFLIEIMFTAWKIFFMYW